MELLKYPRTSHLEGSSLQAGDHDLEQVLLRSLRGKHLIIEEKFDGANAGISFDDSLNLRLQSRGHYLQGGPNEGAFSKLKQWAAAHEDKLVEVLENRYVMYGECMTSKHTVFYDRLPHIFLEFDMLDKHTGKFLSTSRRFELLEELPIISVPMVMAGEAPRDIKAIQQLVRPSLGKSKLWWRNFEKTAADVDYNFELAKSETDNSQLAEGLYIKVEEDGEVTQRLKWVRRGFLQVMSESESHWAHRQKFPNLLTQGADIFAPRRLIGWANNGTDEPLLTRENFKEKVMKRDGHLCVFCREVAVDAHHIFDRQLYADGGYYLHNGAAVCAKHHLDCERTIISVQAVLDAAGISEPVLPPGVFNVKHHDKWGNKLLADGKLLPSYLLGDDEGMLKAVLGNKQKEEVFKCH